MTQWIKHLNKFVKLDAIDGVTLRAVAQTVTFHLGRQDVTFDFREEGQAEAFMAGLQAIWEWETDGLYPPGWQSTAPDGTKTPPPFHAVIMTSEQVMAIVPPPPAPAEEP